MNNQNSEEENQSTIYFSPTGGKLPPIDEEDIAKGSGIGRALSVDSEYNVVIEPLQKALMQYLESIPISEIRTTTAGIIQKLSLPLRDKEGKPLSKYVRLMDIIPKQEHIQQCIGTSEYSEVTEDIANKATKEFLAARHSDAVNHPKHYNSHPSGIECIDIVRHYCFPIGSAIKYLWRAGLKTEQGMSDKQKEIEDLEKAVWYIKDRIEQLKAK